MLVTAVKVSLLALSITFLAVLGCAEVTPPAASSSTYVLGAGDQIIIHALHAEEVSDKPFRIQSDGTVAVPMIGRVKAADLTVGELEASLTRSLRKYYKSPDVTVSVTEYNSQPVSVVGAVVSPGVHQLQGRKTLLEMLSSAGGPRADAGPVVRISRNLRWGVLPIAHAVVTRNGTDFSTGEVSLKELLENKDPKDNILICPQDVISIPAGGTVYVIGEVKKPGAFVLGARPNLSILEALSMAEGLEARAAPGRARILRALDDTGNKRQEVAINVSQILAGKAPDVHLAPYDILFIPDSAAKNAAIRSIEAAVQIGTGLAVYGRR